MSLVGAGPGARDLITLRGIDRLRRADVVVYDDLVDPALLEEAPETAERIYAGKRGWRDGPARPDTGELLVLKAREAGGKRVVRLKGGDPTVFGRAGEEMDKLAAAGIPFEIVPGVTAALASAAASGIPVTLREVSSAVTLLTGNVAAGEGGEEIPVEALGAFAKGGGTLCIYMGLRKLPELVSALQDHGLAPSTPAAVVSDALGAKSRTVTGRLEGIASLAADLPSPALVFVGEVVTHRRAPGQI